MKPVNIPQEKGENRGVKTFSLPIQSSGGHTAVLECYVLDMSERIRWKDRPAVILCPGGAYRFTNDRESEPLACAFLAEGYHVFSLRYSTEKGIYPAALEQLARTVRLIRQNAGEWHVRKDAIVLAGFSAGGHLAAEYACKWDRPALSAAAEAEREELRPNALVLGYPVITAGAAAHEESIHNLLGAQDTPKMRRSVSLETQVSGCVPPVFLWHTATDEMVNAENSLLFASALAREKIPYELHIYGSGVHGVSLGTRATVGEEKHVSHGCAGWFAQAARFLERVLPE